VAKVSIVCCGSCSIAAGLPSGGYEQDLIIVACHFRAPYSCPIGRHLETRACWSRSSGNSHRPRIARHANIPPAPSHIERSKGFRSCGSLMSQSTRIKHCPVTKKPSVALHATAEKECIVLITPDCSCSPGSPSTSISLPVSAFSQPDFFGCYIHLTVPHVNAKVRGLAKSGVRVKLQRAAARHPSRPCCRDAS